MLDGLKTYMLYGNRFCGIEHALKGNQGILYATVLKKSKNTLLVEQNFNVTSVEDLALELPKKQALFLIVNDGNVLTKTITDSNPNPEKLVYNAFPNIQLDNFYYDILTQNHQHFISICRKEHLDTLIEIYQDHSFFVVGISLGNIAASGISGFIKEQSIVTSNAKISFENKHITAIESQGSDASLSYDINGLNIKSKDVLSFAAALGLVLQNLQSVSNFEGLKATLFHDFKQSRYVKQFSKIALVSLLLILLVNFFMFNHYFNAVSTLQQTSQVNQTSKQTLLKLNEEVEKSQKMVEDMLKSSASKSSFYVNAIVQSLPGSVLLSELNYQPLTKNIKKDKPVELEDNVIVISGESNNSEAFSKWLADLETLNWVKDIEILNYGDASKTMSNFSFKINMNHDEKN